MKYQSEIIKEIIDTGGHKKSSLHYESECIERWVDEHKGAYPKLCDYQSEWLSYVNKIEGGGTEQPDPEQPKPEQPDPEPPIGEFPYESLIDVTDATVDNVVPYAYKSAILKGNTKYRDIDTGDILDTFDETKNLELVSVKLPVLTTSNEDGTKTNILTVNEEVELRGIGDVRDTLDCLTGEVTQRIGEVVFDGSEDEPWVADGQLDSNYKFLVNLRNVYYTYHEITATSIISDKFPSINNGGPESGGQDVESICLNGWVQGKLNLSISKTKLSNGTVDELKQWLSQNPFTLQYQMATESVKTVAITVINQDRENVPLKPIEGTMHLSTSSETINPLFSGEIPVEAITQNLASFIKER